MFQQTRTVIFNALKAFFEEKDLEEIPIANPSEYAPVIPPTLNPKPPSIGKAIRMHFKYQSNISISEYIKEIERLAS